MRPKTLWMAAILAATAAPARAQSDQERLQDLERKVEALTGEIERLKLGEAAQEPELQAVPGLGPAASKVYQKASKKVSIGGYGEMNYQNFSRRQQNADPSGKRAQSDLLRAVLYVGYKFNDWILFNSEFEFEHAGSGAGGETRGEVEVEQAYLDFKFAEPFGVRAGHVIVPVGLVNEMHEPTAFHGVLRPNVETSIIPSTWHENGVGVYGRAGPLAYRSFVLAGLTAVATADPTAGGFSAASAIREGRTEGSNSPAEDKAWASRLDLTVMPGATVGGSLYVGQAGQGRLAASVPVSLWDAHAVAAYAGAELKALYAQGRIGNADSVNIAQGVAPGANTAVASDFFGGYVEAAYDVLNRCGCGKGQYLAPFFRYERYDTQRRVPQAWTKDPANSRVEYTLGLTYKPIAQVVIKADQQWMRNQARTGVNQWNLGIGYIF